MKVLLDTSDSQTLSVIPREYPTTIDYTLVEEGNNRIATGSAISASNVSGFLAFADKFQLNEDNYYALYVYNTSTGDLIFRDKVFCTNQSVRGYSINNGEYTQDSTYDGDFIVYGDDNTAPATPTLISVVEV